MTRRYDVRMTIVSQIARCPNGHKIGDELVVGRKTPGGLCMGAFSSLLPYITTLSCGGSFHWEKQEGSGTFCCPDPEVINTFHLQRVTSANNDE